MTIAVRSTQAFVRNLRARLPFRYGIATMTRVPHLILRVTVEIDGQIEHGLAADNLPPKWFTKDPGTSFARDLHSMLAVIGNAVSAAAGLGGAETVFDFWQNLYAAQKKWAGSYYPPLLWNFGVSLVERAVIDAFCRARKTTFAQALRQNSFGLRLGDLFPALAGLTPAELLPAEPLQAIIVRHTVGLSDPLTEADISEADRARDGLPESLEDYLRDDGITHLKIKLGGSIETDLARLRRIAGLLEANGTPCAYTLDGNENFQAVEPFRRLWESLRADPIIGSFLGRLIFVEQPFHRDVALASETCAALLDWPDRPPMIIDESDSEVGVLTQALSGGYIGTSHKNCKGIFKGIANACLIAHRRLQGDSSLQMSAEDLTNVGPIALPADLAVIASLGVTHAERNGHHYFAGLKEFPKSVQQEMLGQHPDLYHPHPRGFPTLRVEQGRIATGSVLAAPFGFAGKLEFREFTPLDEWAGVSLGGYA